MVDVHTALDVFLSHICRDVSDLMNEEDVANCRLVSKHWRRCMSLYPLSCKIRDCSIMQWIRIPLSTLHKKWSTIEDSIPFRRLRELVIIFWNHSMSTEMVEWLQHIAQHACHVKLEFDMKDNKRACLLEALKQIHHLVHCINLSNLKLDEEIVSLTSKCSGLVSLVLQLAEPEPDTLVKLINVSCTLKKLVSVELTVTTQDEMSLLSSALCQYAPDVHYEYETSSYNENYVKTKMQYKDHACTLVGVGCRIGPPPSTKSTWDAIDPDFKTRMTATLSLSGTQSLEKLCLYVVESHWDAKAHIHMDLSTISTFSSLKHLQISLDSPFIPQSGIHFTSETPLSSIETVCIGGSKKSICWDFLLPTALPMLQDLIILTPLFSNTLESLYRFSNLQSLSLEGEGPEDSLLLVWLPKSLTSLCLASYNISSYPIDPFPQLQNLTITNCRIEIPELKSLSIIFSRAYFPSMKKSITCIGVSFTVENLYLNVC